MLPSSPPPPPHQFSPDSLLVTDCLQMMEDAPVCVCVEGGGVGGGLGERERRGIHLCVEIHVCVDRWMCISCFDC